MTVLQNMLILSFMKEELVPRCCEVCQAEIPYPRVNQKTCSKKCQLEREKKSWRERNPRRIAVGVAPSTVGAISELLVCSDLMQRGYSVFRCVSPAARCDLLVLNNGDEKIVSVEVKTGYKNKAGELHCGKPYWNKFDVLAVVVYEDPPRVKYTPAVEEAFALK